MKIKITDNLVQFKSQLDRSNRQVAFATAVALTRTAKQVSSETPAFLERQLDKPTPFTKRGLYIKAARRGNLEAVVGFKNIQAAYLALQERGGTRAPARTSIVLPSNVAVNEYGNIPPAQLRRLYERAKNDKRATKALGKKLGVSSKVDLFVGDPGDGFPPGIYKRAGRGLIPIVVFRQEPVRYRARLGWEPWALRRAQAVLPGLFTQAVEQAFATATD